MVVTSWEDFASPSPRGQPSPRTFESAPEKKTSLEETKPPDWGSLQSPETYQGPVDPTSDEGMFDYVLRQGVRTVHRVGEQILGAAGNIEKFAEDALVNAPNFAGPIGWAVNELVGRENWERFVRGRPHQRLPTSSQFKEAGIKSSGGYTAAKTPHEREFDEFAEDVTNTYIGSRLPMGPQQKMFNHFITPAAANVAKKIVSDLGFGEDAANVAKVVTWLPLTMGANLNAPKYASDLMNNGRNGFSQNLVVNVPVYENQVNQVSRKMLQGDPRSLLAQQQIAGIRNDLASGRTSMPDLMTRYDAINAAKRDRGLFELSAGDRKAAIRNINEVRDVVREQIKTLGQANPQALRDWQNGVQAWATIHQSKKVTNFVQDMATGPYAKILTGPAAALFGLGGWGAVASPGIAGAATVAAGGAYKTGQVLYRMWNDPTLQTYYWNAIGAAMANNVPLFASNYEKLNKKLQESDSSEKARKSNK